MTRKISIDVHETNHSIAEEYATVYDNGLVELRRNVKQKLSRNETDMPGGRLTIEQIVKLANLLTQD